MQRSLGQFDIQSELFAVVAVAFVGAFVVWWSASRFNQGVSDWTARNVRRADLLARVVLGLLVVGYVGWIGGLALARHNAMKSHAYDLGIFTQVLWNTSQGRPFQNTVMIEYAENLLGQHFAPIFLLLVPLFWVWPDPKALLMLQSVALAAGAIPVYRLARRRTSSRGAALLLAATYLMLPALHYVNFFDFHEIALATPLLLAALDFLDQRRLWPMFGCLVVALLCREEIAIIWVAFGLWLLVARRWRWGLPIVAVGAAWLVLTVGYLVPYFQGSSVYYFVVRYGPLGDTIPQILTTLVTRPQFVFQYLTTGDQAGQRLEYLVRLFAPLGAMLPLMGPSFFLLAVPTFGYLLLSDYHEQYDIVNQYSAALIPFLMASTVLGVAWLARLRPFRSWPALIALSSYVLIAAIAGSVQFGPTPIGKKHDREQFTTTDHVRLGYDQALSRIPAGASVSTQSDLVPQLAHRQEVYVFPYLHNADYVLVDNWTDRWPLTEVEWTKALAELVASPLYKLLWTDDGYGVFKRVSPPPIQEPLAVSFLNKVEAVGVDLPKRSARPGETIEVGVYWRAMTPIGVRRIRDRFVTFVHLIGPDGKPIVQVDKEPLDGLTKTDRLLQGEIIRERYLVQVPAGTLPGTYGLDTGLYSFYSKRPLAIFDEAGQRTERFSYRLAQIDVLPGGG